VFIGLVPHRFGSHLIGPSCPKVVESYFKSAQHNFGLNETRLRTANGMNRWIFVSFLAYSLSSLERALEGKQNHIQNPQRFTLTLARAAQTVLETLLLEWR